MSDIELHKKSHGAVDDDTVEDFELAPRRASGAVTTTRPTTSSSIKKQARRR